MVQRAYEAAPAQRLVEAPAHYLCRSSCRLSRRISHSTKARSWTTMTMFRLTVALPLLLEVAHYPVRHEGQ